MTLEKAKYLVWGTYGKDAMENNYFFGTPLPRVKWKCLDDLDDDHLKRLFFNQGLLSTEYRDAITMILRDRHKAETA